MKQFLAITICAFLALTMSGQETQIRKGGGGAGGSATNAVATIRKDGTPIVNGATALDFTNAPGSVVTVTADGTTARIGIPQASAGGSPDAITNGSPTAFRINSGYIESIGVMPRMAGVEFYDSFEREGITNYPGVSDSGHIWQHAAIGTTTNLVYINEGEFKQTTNGVSGASYWGVTRTNNNVNWTWFGGTIKYRGTGANGFEDTATIILSRSLDFNTSQPYLHFRLGRSWLQVQLSQTNTILNEVFPTPLTNNVFYTFNCYVLSNRLVAEVGNYKYEIINDSLAQNSITNATALIYEHNRRTTNITSGWYVSYGDAWAGALPFHMQRYMSDGIRRGSNGAINSINFEAGGEQRYQVKHESDLFQIYDTISGDVFLSINDADQEMTIGGSSAGGVTMPRLVTFPSNNVSGNINAGSVTLASSSAYDATSWNGDLSVPTKDALRDKIETLGSGSGGGGTNFPNVNLLLGNTNLVLSAGVRKAFHNQTNGNHGINLNLAVPESGYVVTYSVSNSSSSDITVTFYTNSVAANPYDIATKTNVNTFTASASAITQVELKYIGGGVWVLEDVKGPAAIQQFGTGIWADTNGVNGLYITPFTRRYTNYASASITINCATDVTANYTNAVEANNTITLATPVIGTSGSLGLVSDGSARTLAILAPVAITWLSTNDTANATNILTTASKRSLFAWRVGTGTDGVSTNIHCWVKNQTP